VLISLQRVRRYALYWALSRYYYYYYYYCSWQHAKVITSEAVIMWQYFVTKTENHVFMC